MIKMSDQESASKKDILKMKYIVFSVGKGVVKGFLHVLLVEV